MTVSDVICAFVQAQPGSSGEQIAGVEGSGVSGVAGAGAGVGSDPVLALTASLAPTLPVASAHDRGSPGCEPKLMSASPCCSSGHYVGKVKFGGFHQAVQTFRSRAAALHCLAYPGVERIGGHASSEKKSQDQ